MCACVRACVCVCGRTCGAEFSCFPTSKLSRVIGTLDLCPTDGLIDLLLTDQLIDLMVITIAEIKRVIFVSFAAKTKGFATTMADSSAIGKQSTQRFQFWQRGLQMASGRVSALREKVADTTANDLYTVSTRHAEWCILVFFFREKKVPARMTHDVA